MNRREELTVRTNRISYARPLGENSDHAAVPSWINRVPMAGLTVLGIAGQLHRKGAPTFNFQTAIAARPLM